MASYCSSSDIYAEIPESAYGSTDSTSYDIPVTNWIATASRFIDRELGVEDNFFYPSTDASTNYYDGSGEREQNIGHWCAITEVAVSEEGEVVSTGYTVWDATDYLTWPYNRLPIRKLIVDSLNGAGSKSVFYSYRKSVRIIGIPGYSLTPPDDIAQVVKIQVVRWMQRAKQMWQDQGASVELGGLVIKGQTQLDPDIKALLYPYKLELAP